jgi:uncharacterized protein (DUF362 family)
MTPHEQSRAAGPQKLDRRALLLGTGAAAVSALGAPLLLGALEHRAAVFVARNQRYDGPIEQTIRDGLLATGLDPALLKGRRVLLKPNMVEPTRTSPHMTTHPAVVRAVAEVFRRWDATVTVGEAPGHVRDTEMALSESGLGEALDADKLPFADLNYEEVGWVKNAGRASALPGFYFPRAVMEADLVVSLPKLKTHHWVGITASLKNLYGTLPGIKYGWPKNVLHHAGIPETVVDINASLPRTISVVDGIVCMEGDGPIMGSPKPLGVLAMGTNLTAVDATCARIMGFEPLEVSYLNLANGLLGPVQDRRIEQRGEAWQKLVSPFTILDRPHLRRMVRQPGELTS